MSGLAPDTLREAVEAHGPVCRVVVAEAKGSAPREEGAAMIVWADAAGTGSGDGCDGAIGGDEGGDGFDDTIGGGALEWEALHQARRMLAAGEAALTRRYPLGPALGQCCGGAATLVYERVDAAVLARIDGAAAAHARPRHPHRACRDRRRPRLAPPGLHPRHLHHRQRGHVVHRDPDARG